MPTHLVFDLDGVLLDSETELDWLNRAIQATLNELEMPATDETKRALFPPTHQSIRTLAHEFDLDANRLWRVRNRHYVRVKCAAIQSGEIEPYDDLDVLPELATDNELHIISNSPTTVVRTFVESNGYRELFTRTIGRGESFDDLTRLKPNSHMYHKLVDELAGERPDVYVGDTESDRAFAEATAMRFIHLTRDQNGVQSLRALPTLLSEGTAG